MPHFRANFSPRHRSFRRPEYLGGYVDGHCIFLGLFPTRIATNSVFFPRLQALRRPLPRR